MRSPGGTNLKARSLFAMDASPIPMGVVGFNPMNASSYERKLDILQEAGNFDCVLLGGTGEKYADALEQRWVSGFRVIAAGYKHSIMSNKSCGVAIALGRKLRKAKLGLPRFLTGRLQGRGLAIRCQTPVVDVLLIVLYFPPVPHARAQYGVYTDACQQIAKWVAKVLDSTPACCTPVLYADLNDGMGIALRGEHWQDVDTAVISQAAKRRERIPGGAGSSLRPVLEQHDFASASSWQDARDTYYGSSGVSSLLDHAFIPSALLAAVRSAGPLARMGRRLQIIRRRGPADHLK